MPEGLSPAEVGKEIGLRTLDASTFNAWYTAKIAGNANGERIANKRFRPAYRVAFDAWIATNPDTNQAHPPDRAAQARAGGRFSARANRSSSMLTTTTHAGKISTIPL